MAEPDIQPNVLLIITDQHRVDHLGFSGNAEVRTQNLDDSRFAFTVGAGHWRAVGLGFNCEVCSEIVSGDFAGGFGSFDCG